MDTIFTFPYKNPNFSTIKELKKTCAHLGINSENLNKIQLIDSVKNHQYTKIAKYANIVVFNSQNYYVPVQRCHSGIKFTKTYDDIYREVYNVNNNYIRYCKSTQKWDPPYIKARFHKLRNVCFYLELQHLHKMCFLFEDILIKDILNHIVILYKRYTDVPVYNIL